MPLRNGALAEGLSKVTILCRCFPCLGNADGTFTVIPLRHHRTLQRRDSWILLFSSPSQAKEYQEKASKLRYLAAKYTPNQSPTAIHLPPDLVAEGQMIGVKQHDYTLTAPFQSLSLVAKLSPFDYKLQRAINIHDNLAQARRALQDSFPVRFWIDRPCRQGLNIKLIKKLLELDGLARGTPWRISDGEGAVVRVGQNSISRISQENYDEDSMQNPSRRVDNWRIDFKCASDAKRFVRVWHRKRLPRLDDLPYYGPQTIVKAECLF